MTTQLSNGAWVGISIVSGIVIASLIGGVGTGISNALRPPVPVFTPDPYDYVPPTGDFSDLETGPPGPSAPVTPMECLAACFDESSAELAILGDDVFAGFGFPAFTHVWKMTGDRTTADLLVAKEREAFEWAGFPADGCFVAWSDSPVIEPAGAEVTADFVAPLTENSSSLYSLSRVLQSVRLFPDAAAAEAYMGTLAVGLASCPGFSNDQGYGFEVTQEPELPVPASVAAVGFVKSPQPGTRYYVFDLQRGNMVIRTVAVSDGGIDDPAFRELVQQQADVMGTLVPAA
jgi:hypothetical protein